MNCNTFRFVVGKESLTISDVADDDEGTYTCITNTILDQDSASAKLTVVGKYSLIRPYFPRD